MTSKQPMGPFESRLMERMKAEVQKGLRNMHISWAPDSGHLTREERAKYILEVMDAPTTPIDFNDSNRDG